MRPLVFTLMQIFSVLPPPRDAMLHLQLLRSTLPPKTDRPIKSQFTWKGITVSLGNEFWKWASRFPADGTIAQTNLVVTSTTLYRKQVDTIKQRKPLLLSQGYLNVEENYGFYAQMYFASLALHSKGLRRMIYWRNCFKDSFRFTSMPSSGPRWGKLSSNHTKKTFSDVILGSILQKSPMRGYLQIWNHWVIYKRAEKSSSTVLFKDYS